MPTVNFTPNLHAHVAVSTCEAEGANLGEVLDRVFCAYPIARGYVLDDQGAVRKHVAVFIDGQEIEDRSGLTDAVKPDSEVFVMQALSGG